MHREKHAYNAVKAISPGAPSREDVTPQGQFQLSIAQTLFMEPHSSSRWGLTDGNRGGFSTAPGMRGTAARGHGRDRPAAAGPQVPAGRWGRLSAAPVAGPSAGRYFYGGQLRQQRVAAGTAGGARSTATASCSARCGNGWQPAPGGGARPAPVPGTASTALNQSVLRSGLLPAPPRWAATEPGSASPPDAGHRPRRATATARPLGQSRGGSGVPPAGAPRRALAVTSRPVRRAVLPPAPPSWRRRRRRIRAALAPPRQPAGARPRARPPARGAPTTPAGGGQTELGAAPLLARPRRHRRRRPAAPPGEDGDGGGGGRFHDFGLCPLVHVLVPAGRERVRWGGSGREDGATPGRLLSNLLPPLPPPPAPRACGRCREGGAGRSPPGRWPRNFSAGAGPAPPLGGRRPFPPPPRLRLKDASLGAGPVAGAGGRAPRCRG